MLMDQIIGYMNVNDRIYAVAKLFNVTAYSIYKRKELK